MCMDHLKMKAIYVDGRLARFCQQCGRFHDLSKFDGHKRCVKISESKDINFALYRMGYSYLS